MDIPFVKPNLTGRRVTVCAMPIATSVDLPEGARNTKSACESVYSFGVANLKADTTIAISGGVRAPALQGFAAAAAASDGVSLASLAAIDQLEVRTRNSLYRITVLDGGTGRVLVLGGEFFPVWCEAHCAGSTLGGSLLKMGWVGRGFCMEFTCQGQRIVTTRAREVRRVAAPAGKVC